MICVGTLIGFGSTCAFGVAAAARPGKIGGDRQFLTSLLDTRRFSADAQKTGQFLIGSRRHAR
jgi:hypothetical protein